MTCSLRPHLIWGPRDRHLIPRLLQRAGRGQLRRVGDGTNLIDMVYVENAAAGPSAGRRRAGARLAGRRSSLLHQPGRAGELLAVDQRNPGTGRTAAGEKGDFVCGRVANRSHPGSRLSVCRVTSEPRMTRFLAAQLARHHYFDIRRARPDFGYSPQIATADGMRRLAEELAGKIPAVRIALPACLVPHAVRPLARVTRSRAAVAGQAYACIIRTICIESTACDKSVDPDCDETKIRAHVRLPSYRVQSDRRPNESAILPLANRVGNWVSFLILR